MNEAGRLKIEKLKRNLCDTINDIPFSLELLIPRYDPYCENIIFLKVDTGFTWKCIPSPFRFEKNNVVNILFRKEICALEALKGPSFIPELLLFGKSLSNYHILLKHCGDTRQLKDWCLPSNPSKCDISSPIFAGLTECYWSILNDEMPPGSVSMDCYLSIFKQLIDAIAYIHSHGFFHGHIRTKNILVCPDGTVQLTNFELSGPIGSLLLKSPDDDNDYYPQERLKKDDVIHIFAEQEDGTLTSSTGRFVKTKYDGTVEVERDGERFIINEKLIQSERTNHVGNDWLALGISFYRCLIPIRPDAVFVFDRMCLEKLQLRSCLTEEIFHILDVLLCKYEDGEVLQELDGDEISLK